MKKLFSAHYMKIIKCGRDTNYEIMYHWSEQRALGLLDDDFNYTNHTSTRTLYKRKEE